MGIIIGLLFLWFAVWLIGRAMREIHVAFAPRKVVDFLRSKPELLAEWCAADDHEQAIRELDLIFPTVPDTQLAAAMVKAAKLIEEDARNELARERLARHGVEIR